MRGFTLLELLVVLFIIMTLAFLTFPSVWGELLKDDNVTLASTLGNLRREAVSRKKELFFTVDFKERQFRVSGVKGEQTEKPRIIDMQEGETWEVFIPSKGTIKEGQVIVAFSPSVQEELIALYHLRNGKETSIILNNLSGQVEIEEGKRKFDE
jgi:prepilin-type N-terminal cleavage/methylation domain-containing protein